MNRLYKISPYLILLGGFALRLYRLGVNSLWYDETVSMNLAQSDIAELIRHTAGDIHPPLYYLLLHFWGQFAGWSEFAAAFLSLSFGILLIAIVYRVTREWFPTNHSTLTAIIAALLVALSPYNVWYSQEVRMYTVGATLGLLSVYFLRRLLENKKQSALQLIAYALITAAGMYTLYYFAFLIAFEWLWVTIRVWQMANRGTEIGSRSTLLAPLSTFLTSQLLLLILYLPWLPIAFRQATDPPVPPWREFIALPRVLLETSAALTFGQSVDPNIFGILALAIFIAVAALLWRARISAASSVSPATTVHRLPITDYRSPLPSPRSPLPATQSPLTDYRSPITAPRSTVSPLFLLGYILVPLALIYGLSFYKPLYHVRYMFTYSPAFYILAAYAFVNLGNAFVRIPKIKTVRWLSGQTALAALFAICFLVICGYSLNNFWHSDQYAEDDLRGAVNYIAERWHPGDVILVNAGYTYPALTYYYPGAIVRERLTQYNSSDAATASDTTPLVLQTGSIDGSPNLGWGDPRSDFYATTAAETDAALDRVFQDHPRVWMLRIYDTVVDPNGIIRAYFAQHATPLDDHGFTGESQTRVQGFLTHPTLDLPPETVNVKQNLADRVEFVGYDTRTRDVARGDYFDVTLYWKLLQAANYNYQVTLQILDSGGNKVAQAPDEVPLSDLLPMTRWQVGTLYREPLRVKLDTLIPGTYRAIVKMYEPRSNDVLGDVIELGEVRVH